MSVAMRRLNENITQLIKVKWIPIIYFAFVFTAAAVLSSSGELRVSVLSCEDCTVKWRCGKCRSKSLSSSSFQCSICSKTFPDTVPECTNKLLLYCTGHRSINMVIGDLGTLGRCSCVRHEQYILWHNFFLHFWASQRNISKIKFW